MPFRVFSAPGVVYAGSLPGVACCPAGFAVASSKGYNLFAFTGSFMAGNTENIETATRDAARRHVRQIVVRSRSSFGPGMRILGKEKRHAMYAVYAFCREVDDIADDRLLSAADKRRKLDRWRGELDRIFQDRMPRTRTGIALAGAVRRFNLPAEEFHLVIEGMEMDASGPVVAPALQQFYAYTRRVAGAVGILSISVFTGRRDGDAEKFALYLGDALQITNILRDLEEDCAEGRLYLPREILDRHGCSADPAGILLDGALPSVMADVAVLAREKFSAARSMLRNPLDWRTVRPALLMMGIYETCLDRMTARGWPGGRHGALLGKTEKALVAARWFFAPPLSSHNVSVH